MFLLEVQWVRSIMPQQSAKDDPEAASTMKAAIITTIGTSMRTGRYVLAARYNVITGTCLLIRIKSSG